MYFRCIVLCLFLGMAIPTTSALKTEFQIRVNKANPGKPFNAEIKELDTRGSIKNITNENLGITADDRNVRKKLCKALKKLVASGKIELLFTYNGKKNEALVIELNAEKNYKSFEVIFQFEVLPYPKVSVNHNGGTEFEGFLIASRSKLLFLKDKEFPECNDSLQSDIWNIKGDGAPTTVEFLYPAEETDDGTATLILINRHVNLQSAVPGYLSLYEMSIELYLTEAEASKIQEEFKQVNYWNYHFDGLQDETCRIVPTRIEECFAKDKSEGYVYLTLNFTPAVSKEEVSENLAKQKEEVILYTDEGRLYGFVCKDNTVEIYVKSNGTGRFRKLIMGNQIWAYQNAAGKLTKIRILFEHDCTFIKSKLRHYEYAKLAFTPTVT